MHFLSIPRELQLNIVEESIAQHRRTRFALALVCKSTCSLTDYIIYHSITLSTPRAIRLLARTAASPTGSKRLARRVENLIVKPVQATTSAMGENIATILRSCTNVRSLALPDSFASSLSLSVLPSTFLHYPTVIAPLELTLSALAPLPKSVSPLLSRCTHLTFAEPPEKWIEPLPLLASLPISLPHLSSTYTKSTSFLTHLSLARREHSNTENDMLFAYCIACLLHPTDCPPQFRSLTRILIRIFPVSGNEHDPEAEIWTLLREVIKGDKRVVLRRASWGRWIMDWEVGVKGALVWEKGYHEDDE